MNAISWDNKSYKIDNKPAFLVSGEFHYFRVPKSEWKRRLQMFKETGGNCVATYIPWLIHEPVEGDIRFGDIPQRDIEAFLQLCGEMGLYVICRPGPYVYSELKCCGLPKWLLNDYPEIHAKDINGNFLHNSSVSYLHPVFLEKARKWYDAVCPILKKYTLKNGGPVAYIQIDNELMGIHIWYGSIDYNSETIGLGVKNGRYSSFLSNRYCDISKVNYVYGSSYKQFEDVMPWDSENITNDNDRRRVKDYQEFYFSMVAEYVSVLARWIRSHEIDCDIIHNSANPNMNSFFMETIQKLEEGFLLGADHYYNLNMDWESNNPTPKYALRVFYSNEMLRLMGFPPTIFELPAGSLSDWPPITPQDLKCCYFINLAFGLKGLNYYIFTGGPNIENTCSIGEIYDFSAPVSAVKGEMRPAYYILKEFGKFLKNNSWLAVAEKEADFYVGLDWEMSRSNLYFDNKGSHDFSNVEAWEFLSKGMLITSLCSSYSPNLIDLYKDTFTSSIEMPLFIPTSECMAKNIQERLIRFVKNGGKLLLAPVIPYLDENFNNCTLLKEFLENAGIEKYQEPNIILNIGPVRNVFMNGSVWKSIKRPHNAKQIAFDSTNGTEVGWKCDYDNGGMVIWLGFNWKYGSNNHKEMFLYLMDELGKTEPLVKCDNPNIWTVMRTDGQHRMLFVLNLFSSPMCANIEVKLNNGNYYNTGMHLLAPMEVKTVDI